MATPPLKRMPYLEPAPIPLKKAKGTLSTKAQGQLITRKVSAVYTHFCQSPVSREGITATATAAATTKGVYTRAKRVIKRSMVGLEAAAFSTLSRILVTMDSASTFSTRILSIPLVFTQPETISSPKARFTGTGSPVTGEVSTRLSPSITTPSKGMRSPARTKRISPTCTSSAGITFTSSPTSKFTTSGRISTASIIWPRLFSTARCSKYSPTR